MATKKISEFTTLGSLSDSDILPVVNAGSNKKITGATLKTYAQSGLTTGPAGADGAQGPAGNDGAPGQGVPTGGTVGQVLAKIDSTDYNTEWVNQTGGATNEITNTDGTSTYSVSVGTDGNLTLPDIGNITSNTSLQLTTTFGNYRTVEYQTAGIWEVYVDDYNTGPYEGYSRINVTFKDNQINKPQVYIENQAANTGVPYRWIFDENGNLTLPAGGDIKDSTGASVLGGASGSYFDTVMVGGSQAAIADGTTQFELVAGTGIAITAGSNNQITISSTAPATPHKGFRAHYGRLYNNTDDENGPINKIVIYKDTVTPASAIDTSSNSDDFQVTGLTGSDVVAMLVVVSDGTDWATPTSTATLQTFAEAVIDSVILNGGVEGDVNSIGIMKEKFEDNFNTFNSIIPNVKTNLEFFVTPNNPQYNLSNVTYNGSTGDGANFYSMEYNFVNSRFELISWDQIAPAGYTVGDTFTILGINITDNDTGNPFASPDNDTTITVVSVNGQGYINETSIATGIPVPATPGPVWPNYSISDGGDDEYDGANAIHTNLATNIPYNSGNVVSSSSAFNGGDYVVTYKNGIFGVFATNANIDIIGTSGNNGGYGNDPSSSGFDGDGVADTGGLYGEVVEVPPATIIANTDGTSTYSVSVGTDGVVTMNTARGGLEFGAQPEVGGPTHFHIMRPAGENGSGGTDLYFGDDYNYVLQRPAAYGQAPGYGVEIGTNDNDGGDQHVWRFGTDGTLTLPGNYSIGPGEGSLAIFSPNAVAIVADQGTSNQLWLFGTDGNLTLPAGGVIEDNTGNIKLKPSGASSATQALVIYPTAVDGNHIHLTADGGETDLYLGSDSQYVKIDHGGTVVVRTSGANTSTWTFGTDGYLTLPNDSANGDPILTIQGGANPGILSDAGGGPGNFNITAGQLLIGGSSSTITITPDDGEIKTYANMVLTTNGSAEPTQWTLGTDGSTIFPTLTTQRGDNPSGTITGQTLLFGDDTQEAIISTPNGDATNNNSQRLVINPGYGYNGGEGGDIYLWAGRGGATNGNGGDIKIRGGAGPGNGYGGYVRIDGGDVEANGTPGYVEIRGGDCPGDGVISGGEGGHVQLRGGTAGSDGTGGYVEIKGGTSTGGDGGDINIQGGDSSEGAAYNGAVNILTGGHTWTFDNGGYLTLPADKGILAPTNFTIEAQGTYYPGFGADARTGVATVYADNNVVIRSHNHDNGQLDWTFDADGNLTLPAGGDILDSTGATVLGGGTTLPANASGYLVNDGAGALSWAAGDGTFSGDYNDLTNKPTYRIAVATGAGPGGNLQADSLALAGLNPVTDIPSTWGGDLILQGGVGGANGDLYGEVRIKSGQIGANYEWHFTTDKKIKLPAGGNIVDSTGATAFVSLATLKQVVADSTDFADFQTRIANM